jgi:cellulose synthase/poly-beta-1,6-N-acetylglucosamine synthase-like glycosyltransferase
MEIAFFLLLFFLVYSYLIYPLLLAALKSIVRKPWKQRDVEVPVSIVVSAFNEEGVIREKVLNTLRVDYPEKLLEVVVSSDGSTDKTNEVVSNIKDPRVRLHAFPQRSGKSACLNRVVPHARGEIVLFTDANSALPPFSVRKIVRNFHDQEVGLVTGWTQYRDPAGKDGSAGAYWRYEKLLKVLESAIGSCVGADGAIFAMRKSLYRPLRDDDINDFVIPLNVIEQKKRVVLDPEVFCFEDTSEKPENEFRRQVRITTRTLWAIRRNMRLLNPRKFGWFSFFMFSHKVMRFVIPLFLVGTFVVNLFLLGLAPFYRLTFLGQGLFLVGASAGLMIKRRNGMLDACAMLFVTFAAQGLGWLRMLAGIGDTMWTPQRWR